MSMIPDTITLATTVKQSDKILVQNLDEDTVMANIDSGYYFGVNQTSKRIWELVASPITIADVCTSLQEEYDVDAATCEADVLAIVKELAREGLVQVM
jgi:hypothetical protein